MSNDLKSQIAATFDATGVEAGVGKAKKSLADLATTAKASGKQAAEGIDAVGASSDSAAKATDRATRSMVAAIQRSTAALEAGGRGTAAYYAEIARQRGIDPATLKPYLEQLDQVTTKQKAAAQAASVAAPAVAQIGMSARATAAALRGVPAQFTDIITSIQGGQAPITVFLQQGGQLKDMFGGVGAASRALGGYVLGLINPLTIAAATVGVLALAYMQGSKEAEAFGKAIILSGNAAGTTTSQLGDMAREIGSRFGYTQKEAAAALATITQTGAVSAAQLQRFAQVALDIERATGQSVAKTAEVFKDLQEAPLTASVKLNEQINFLTVSTYQQVKALTEQGRATDAARVAQEAYAATMAERTKQITQNVGFLETAWKGLTKAAAEAWDAMLNIGRAETGNEQLDRLKKTLAEREQRGPLNEGTRAAFDKGNESLRSQIALMERLNGVQSQTAKQEAERSQGIRQLAEWDKQGDTFKQASAKRDEEIRKARIEGQALIAKGLITEKDLTQRIADIRKKYESADAPGKKVAKATLGYDLEKLQGTNERVQAVYGNTEKVLEALRQAGLVSEQDYFAQKRSLLESSGAAQEQFLVDSIARMQREKLTGDAKIDNDKKIADAEAHLAVQRRKNAADQVVLSIQEATSIARVQAAYEGARRVQQDYLDLQSRQQERELTGLGQGTRARSINAGVAQIEDRYQSQKRELENQRALARAIAGPAGIGAAEEKNYADRLALLDEFQTKSIDSYKTAAERKLAIEKDWTVGASEALRNYVDESQNAAKMMEDAFTRGLGSLEDALVKFATTGKLSITDMVNSIIADLARIVIKQNITGPLAQALGNVFSGGGSSPLAGATGFGDYNLSALLAGARADGGPVAAGKSYLVGERGYEVFTPSQSGTITPNDKLGGSGIVYAPVIQIDGTADKAAAMASMQRALKENNRQLVQELRTSGVLA